MYFNELHFSIVNVLSKRIIKQKKLCIKTDKLHHQSKWASIKTISPSALMVNLIVKNEFLLIPFITGYLNAKQIHTTTHSAFI